MKTTQTNKNWPFNALEIMKPRRSTQTKQINEQTPGPIRATRANEDFDEVFYELEADEAPKPYTALRAKDWTLICAHDLSTMTEADGRLLASGYNAFDRAARALNVDAAELAEGIDLAGLIRDTQDLANAFEILLRLERIAPETNETLAAVRAQLSKLPKPQASI